WEGTGVIDYEVDGRSYSGEFAHRVSFSHDGGAFLNYSADAWLIDAGDRRPLVSEIGYWRLARPAGDADAGPALLPPTA
ncbi:FABP family protein, partial [Vibrio parahaemolyticus]|nr:FABP family protein [Vibrio parahaemolyticus]